MPPPLPQSPPPWHSLPAEEIFLRLASSPAGLTGDEAARRLSAHGPNELQAGRTVSPWAIFFAQFKNVLIVILLFATVFSAFLGDAIEAAAIAAIVLFAVLLGFVQEYRAERAIEALNRLAAPTARVLRDGEEKGVPARNLVPGEVVVLAAGDKIPADLRLIETVHLRIDEASLTGESVPVEKRAAVLDRADLALGDRNNMAYAGTAATHGRGRAVVVATGMATEFGKIARMLQGIETGKTPLQENLDRVGRNLARIILVIVAAVVGLGLFRGLPFLPMLVFGIALAVAAVPEALPAVVTISLALGVRRMVKRHALMRRLAAVETLGSTTVICSDKTGTLTKDEMTVQKIFVAGEVIDVTGAGYAPHGRFLRAGVATTPSDPVKRLFEAAVLASDARFAWSEPEGRWLVRGDPTEGALVVAAAKAGIEKPDLDARFPRVDEIPFSSETKRMTTLCRGPDAVIACSKGASEIIIGACTRQMTAEKAIPFGEKDREAAIAAARGMAAGALRVLAVAVKSDAVLESAGKEMTFLGLVGMIDPPRAEAGAAIRTCIQAGIRPVMITGDHPLTARAVAGGLGLLTTGRVLTGEELDAMGDAEFDREVEAIEVYARVSPEHKLRVVTALQRKGHVVAMTGDGVNDAPAVKKADIGVAMGITGTDVTKEAAAVTLTDDNFASIVAAVEEGRGIFENIKKYLMYLLSSNLGEIGLVAGASLLGMPIPLTAVQILYVNLATDGLPALALAVDPPEPDLMRRAPRNPGSGIFTRPVVALIGAGGAWSTLANVGLFAWACHSGRGIREAMTMTFASLVLIQFFKAYNFRSDRLSVIHRPFANTWLNLAIAWELLLLAAVVYIPALHAPFGTVGLSATDWLIIITLAFSVSPVLEITKWMARRGWFGHF